MHTEIHPIDFDKLSKGMWVETSELERIVGCGPDDRRWRLRVLAFRQEITDRTGILVRMDHDRLRLMTDSEAYAWNLDLAMKREAGLHRCAQNTALIDRSQLSPAELAEADHAQRKIAAMAAAASMASKRAERERQLYGNLNPKELDHGNEEEG